MKFIAVFFLFTTVAPALATDLRPLTQAKSQLDLELAVAGAAELTAARGSCVRELATADLPRSCFAALRLEAKTPPAWLERLCERRARGAARVGTLRETSELPERCREAARERRRDLEYRLEAENPAELWTGS